MGGLLECPGGIHLLEDRWELLPALLGDMESGEYARLVAPGEEDAVPPPAMPRTPPPAAAVMSEAESELRIREICLDCAAAEK